MKVESEQLAVALKGRVVCTHCAMQKCHAALRLQFDDAYLPVLAVEQRAYAIVQFQVDVEMLTQGCQ